MCRFLWAAFLAQHIFCGVLEKLIVIQPVKKFPTLIEPSVLLLCSPEPATKPHLEPVKMFSYFRHEVGAQ